MRIYKQYKHKKKYKTVVSYRSPKGEILRVCQQCEPRPWPIDSVGQSYQSVFKGQHSGTCDVCGTFREPTTKVELALLTEVSS